MSEITRPQDNAFPKVAESYGGLSKREYFAAMAMQGLITSGISYAESVAPFAVKAADALIAALNEKPE